MPESFIFYHYAGEVDQRKTDLILKKLKESREFIKLDKTTGKRVYAILVESLENINRHSAGTKSPGKKFIPFVSVMLSGNKVCVKAGNQVPVEKRAKLKKKLDDINTLNESELKILYEQEINKKPVKGENGAGLGFILMRLKSGNQLEYNFTETESGTAFFEINITINKYAMRKLIVNQTSNSPRVVLDPEKNHFEISGESRPPDVHEFYGEVFRWLDEYSVHLEKSSESDDAAVFNFDLEYFNSSSAKCILDFCKQLAGFRDKGNKIKIRWHYEEEDIDMLEVGREMSKISKFPFEYVIKGQN